VIILGADEGIDRQDAIAPTARRLPGRSVPRAQQSAMIRGH
jgi:hypothetical protein